MANAREIMKQLLARAKEDGLSIPGADDTVKGVAIGQILMQHHTDMKFDVEAAYAEISAKYARKGGKKPKPPAPAPAKVAAPSDDESEEEDDEKPKKKKAAAAKKKAPAKKRKPKAEDEDEESDEEEEEKPKKKKKKKNKAPKKAKKEADEDSDGEEDGSPKKKKKLELACEANEGIAAALLEIAGHCFKEKDTRRGAAYQKARTAVMECEVPIRSGKQAKGLSGIGDSIAKKIEEFISTGTMQILEEIRARENEVM